MNLTKDLLFALRKIVWVMVVIPAVSYRPGDIAELEPLTGSCLSYRHNR